MLLSANLGFLFPEIDSLPEKYIASQRAGFSGVECGDVYSYPVHELLAVQQSTNLEQVLLNIYTGETKGHAAIPGQTEEFQKSLELSIQYCLDLKCKRIHILSGKFPDDVEITHELRESYRKTFISNLHYASKRLSTENINILIEPISAIPRYFLTRTDQALNILDELDCPNVQLQLDLYHHQRTHGNIIGTLDKYLSRIGHIQVAQVPGRHEPDANGEINYKYVFDHLKKIDYRGWIGCEYVPQKPEYFQWMEIYKNSVKAVS